MLFNSICISSLPRYGNQGVPQRGTALTLAEWRLDLPGASGTSSATPRYLLLPLLWLLLVYRVFFYVPLFLFRCWCPSFGLSLERSGIRIRSLVSYILVLPKTASINNIVDADYWPVLHISLFIIIGRTTLSILRRGSAASTSRESQRERLRPKVEGSQGLSHAGRLTFPISE